MKHYVVQIRSDGRVVKNMPFPKKYRTRDRFYTCDHSKAMQRCGHLNHTTRKNDQVFFEIVSEKEESDY